MSLAIAKRIHRNGHLVGKYFKWEDSYLLAVSMDYNGFLRGICVTLGKCPAVSDNYIFDSNDVVEISRNDFLKAWKKTWPILRKMNKDVYKDFYNRPMLT